MSDVAIRTSELGKRYTLGTRQYGYDTLRESLGRVLRRPVGRRGAGGGGKPRNVLWALRDLSVEIHSGEVVGIIGHNGAGKSTLLKILSRITEPSTGYADVTGRVGSLLEVGTGFHPELTGRENIFLNGAILGMRRFEIQRRFDEIVAFAEVERFLDTPVKRYSSGMSVRLAFAVAAHLEPEILLVDEVLAVGDAAFQRKSLNRMGEVAEEGRTVIFVSHNLALISALCHRGIVLERGDTLIDAPATEAIDHYLRTLERAASRNLLEREDRNPRGWDETLVSKVEVLDDKGNPTDAVVGGRPATVAVEVTEVVAMMECRLTVVNSLGQPVVTLDSELSSPADQRDPTLGPRIECHIDPVTLLPGRYRIDILLKGKRQIQDGLQAAAFFDVEPGVFADRPMPPAGGEGNVVVPHSWRLPT